MSKCCSIRAAAAAGSCMLLLVISVPPVRAQQAPSDNGETEVYVHVAPFVELEFLSTPLLYLEVPDPGSTAPDAGVAFVITGNASSSVTAWPSAFIEIPGQGFIGLAEQNDDQIGYQIQVRFPRAGQGLEQQTATLPGHAEVGTAPLSVNLAVDGSMVEGVVHMETSHRWTPDDSVPPPGLYVGSVTLTVSID